MVLIQKNGIEKAVVIGLGGSRQQDFECALSIISGCYGCDRTENKSTGLHVGFTRER